MSDDFARAEQAIGWAALAVVVASVLVDLAARRLAFARDVRDAELALRDVDADAVEKPSARFVQPPEPEA